MLPDKSFVLVQTYYYISDENIDLFKRLSEDIIECTRGEMGCLYFGFSYQQSEACCLESYKNSQSLMAHLSNIDDLSVRMSTISKLKSKNIHASLQELVKLKEFLVGNDHNYFKLESYFQN